MKITKDQVRKSREKFGDARAKGMSERCIDYKSRYEAVCAELEELQKKYDDLQEHNMQLQSIEVWTNKAKADAVREAVKVLEIDQHDGMRSTCTVWELIEYADKLEQGE